MTPIATGLAMVVWVPVLALATFFLPPAAVIGLALVLAACCGLGAALTAGVARLKEPA